MKGNVSLCNYLVVTMLSGAVLVGVARCAVAAEERYTIKLSANIPSEKFHVLPVEVGWINQTQEMLYNYATGQLKIFEKQFQFKSDSGAIQASVVGNLTDDGKPYLSNGSEVIPLVVSFNKKIINNTSTIVTTADEAKAGGRTMLQISQAENKKLAVSGSFAGDVEIIFEPVLMPVSNLNP